MNRISPRQATVIKEELIGGLGLEFERIANSLYGVQGKLVNIKLTSPRSSGRYWFNIQRRAHSYLWICWDSRVQDWESYYWIPAQTMKGLIRRGSYRDWTWERRGRPIPNFMIDVKTDEYLAGTTTISIGQFRDLKAPP